MKLRKLIDLLLDHCRRYRSPATYRSYADRLKSLRQRHGRRKLSRLKRRHLEQFLERANHWADGREKANDTQRANIIVLQRLQRFGVEIGALSEPIIDRIPKPPGRHRERIPTRAELALIFRACPRPFRLIARALWQSGARPGELARARIEEYDAPAGLIVLERHKTARKTGKPRRIGVGRKLARIVQRSIGERTAGPIFVDENGRQWSTQKLSRTFKGIVRRLNLDDELCLYSLRHAHATELCAKAGIHAAAQALGHASIQTTQRYVHPDDESLRRHQDLI